MKVPLSEQISEYELLCQLRDGKATAFEHFYQLHSRILYNNILYLVKDREVSKELLQDLYLKIWEHRAALNPDKPFKSYLFTIARNLVYDYFRRVSLDKRMMVIMMANAAELYNPVEDGIDYKDSRDSLEKAIELLPAQSKNVFVLCKIEGKSHEEISRELGISISTVNNHMVKANKIVRDYLLKNKDLMALMFAFSFIGKI